jgi:hypothetical protein
MANERDAGFWSDSWARDGALHAGADWLADGGMTVSYDLDEIPHWATGDGLVITDSMSPQRLRTSRSAYPWLC